MILSLTSCDDWLDVKPENEVTQDNLFKSSFGFRTAINGLYHNMASMSLYGIEMTCGTVDVLSRQYDINEESMCRTQYLSMNEYDFLAPYAKSTIEDMWAETYNIIANANNIINNVDKKGEDFFECGSMEKNLIKGEALAVRAFLHFDMLRLFAPAPIKNDDGAYIPYVDTYPDVRPISDLSSECLKNIIADLEEAQKLTLEYDTTEIGRASYASPDARFKHGYDYSTALNNDRTVDLFFMRRGYRLNNSAITALLARVYQYAGEHEKALACAEKIIDLKYSFNGKEFNVYKFLTDGTFKKPASDVWDDYLGAWEQKTNLRLLNNLIFACYQPEFNEPPYQVWRYFAKQTRHGSSSFPAQYFVVNYEKQKVFYNKDDEDESMNDIRFKNLIFWADFKEYPISGKWYCSETEGVSKYNVNIIPLVRLTEMYYIAAESYARSGNFDKANQLLEKVRSERGCSASLKITNWNEFETELIRDARREWISEGQLFYLYKRLDAKVDFADGKAPRKLTRKQSELPVPENQSL